MARSFEITRTHSRPAISTSAAARTRACGGRPAWRTARTATAWCSICPTRRSRTAVRVPIRLTTRDSACSTRSISNLRRHEQFRRPDRHAGRGRAAQRLGQQHSVALRGAGVLNSLPRTDGIGKGWLTERPARRSADAGRALSGRGGEDGRARGQPHQRDDGDLRAGSSRKLHVLPSRGVERLRARLRRHSARRQLKRRRFTARARSP